MCHVSLQHKIPDFIHIELPAIIHICLHHSYLIGIWIDNTISYEHWAEHITKIMNDRIDHWLCSSRNSAELFRIWIEYSLSLWHIVTLLYGICRLPRARLIWAICFCCLRPFRFGCNHTSLYCESFPITHFSNGCCLFYCWLRQIRRNIVRTSFTFQMHILICVCVCVWCACDCISENFSLLLPAGFSS